MLCWADLPRALTRTKQPTRKSIKPPVPVFRLSVLVALSWLALASLTARGQEPCAAPAPVCAAQDSVFVISTPFDPLASATLMAPELLVTNRHVVADETRVEVTTADGGRLVGAVVASAFAGDLVLVRVPGLEGEPLARGEAGEGLLYAIGVDDASGRVRVYAPGHRLAAPAEGKPLARLHHTARSQPGNSGGALVNENGWLVGIVAAGGDGRNDAIPASRLADLEAASGPGREAEAIAQWGAQSFWGDQSVSRGWIPVAPVAPPGERWFSDEGRSMLAELLDSLENQFTIEGGKFHIAGCSNGGRSAFHIALEFPDRFPTNAR